MYFNLKKRFHKRRNFLKRLQRSGTTNQLLLKKARSDVKVYSFLDWLIPYTQVRQPRVPIKPEEAGMLEAKYGAACLEMEEFDDRPSFVDLNKNYDDFNNQNGSIQYVKQENMEEDLNLGDNEEEILTIRPSSPIINHNSLLHSSLNADCQRESENEERSKQIIDQEESIAPKRLRLSNSCSTSVNGTPDDCNTKRCVDYNGQSPENRSFQTQQLDNEDQLFGLMVGAELKGFPYKEKCIAKLKIQNVLFDIQMSLLKKTNQNSKDEREKSFTI